MQSAAGPETHALWITCLSLVKFNKLAGLQEWLGYTLQRKLSQLEFCRFMRYATKSFLKGIFAEN